MDYPIWGRIIPPVIGLWIKKINGLENIPKTGGLVVSANHSSYLDHLMISSIVVKYSGRKIHYLAKKEHFEKFFQRLWHKNVGAIPIDRQSGGKEALNTAVKYLNDGKIIGVYPEGTRTLTGKLQRARTGAARLALAAKVPVLPIGLIGTFDIMPKGQHYPKMKRAVVNIGKPLYFKEYYGKEEDKAIIRLVTTKIMREIASLCGQRYEFD
ncbi:1-acyl-sn-glycerol-3-phosphate acyltransferase [Candidatus Woesearchaeota archaeon]|nr:1-acyl-sn-glycerol-3-phosphate acyltransferase [Candidatus Woesearchaeota archaeon]